MTPTHTPGPWKDKPSIHGNQYRYVQIGKDETYTTLEVLPADAKLIAAAPDLRDALEGLLAEVDAMTARTGWAGNGFREKARAALARCEL
jgi:hypothetical protein